MTLRSSKNHPTTRANTRTWTPFELARPWELALLGAWLATVLPVTLPAAERVTVGRATLVNGPRTAEDRWKRLKSLYPLSEEVSSTVKADTDAQPSKTNEVFRPIPDEPANPESSSIEDEISPDELIEPDVMTDTELNNPATTSIPLQPLNPISPLDEEPAWVLPATTVPDSIEESPAAISTTKPEQKHVVPAPVEASSSPRKTSAVAVSTIRQVSEQSHIAPVQVRRIDTIMPVYDPEADREIRNEAALQSREIAKRYGVDHFAPDPYTERSFPEVVMPWEAPNFHYHPLYFQDAALERYGHTYAPVIQPLVSIGRFSTQLVFLPYQMALNAPWSEEYALGYYRPGEVAPKLHYQAPLNAKAAAVQAATVTGLIFLIP